MAAGHSSGAKEVGELQSTQSAEEPLSDDALLEILCRQLRGRNRNYSSPAFKQKLAEEVLVRRIGDFRVGDRMFIGFSDVELETECTCGASDPSLCREVSFPIARSECVCQELDELIIQGIHPSGSKREGNDVRLNGGYDWSDVDVMVRLGPIRISGEITPVPGRTDSGSWKDQQQEISESTSSPEDGIVVRLEPTDHPGFVLLHHRPRPDCRHSEWLPLSAQRLKQNIRVIGNLGKTKALKKYRFGSLVTGGPALSSEDEETVADLVPCVTLPRWPCEEYRTRRRPLLQPPPELVERLCRTPAMLVPVGFEGSRSQPDQWRLSFSRHEHMALHALTELQRDCLAVLKHCCAVLFGPHGDVKGAYLKMALFWVCEETGPNMWETEGLRWMALRVLSYVEDCASRARLPCYFWTEINMLATRTEEELSRLGSAVRCLKAHLMTATAALVAVFVRYGDSGVSDPRLPGRGWSALWQFVLQRAQPVPPEVGLLHDTWLTKENFCGLLGTTSTMTLVYQRVLASLGGSGSQDTVGSDEYQDDWLTEQ